MTWSDGTLSIRKSLHAIFKLEDHLKEAVYAKIQKRSEGTHISGIAVHQTAVPYFEKSESFVNKTRFFSYKQNLVWNARFEDIDGMVQVFFVSVW